MIERQTLRDFMLDITAGGTPRFDDVFHTYSLTVFCAALGIATVAILYAILAQRTAFQGRLPLTRAKVAALGVGFIGIALGAVSSLHFEDRAWSDHWQSYTDEACLLLLGFAFWLETAIKRLVWLDSWNFHYPLATPPELNEEEIDEGLHAVAPYGERRYDGRKGTRLLLYGWFFGLLSTFVLAKTTQEILKALYDHHTDPKNSLLGFQQLIAGWGIANSRKTLLQARGYRAKIIAAPRILHAGSYVLYLRSFKDDQARNVTYNPSIRGRTGGMLGAMVSGRSEEEQIANALAPVGRMVAVGAPGERLPYAGAVRMYLPEKNWKEPVRQLMKRARLVTLTLGSSPGTMWELSEAMRILPPQRLLVLVPGIRKEDYESIRKSNAQDLHRNTESARPAIPSYPFEQDRTHQHVIGVIHFSADWESTFTPTSRLNPGNLAATKNPFTSLISGLSPGFKQLAAHEENTGLHCG
jgi:hypothetical protein